MSISEPTLCNIIARILEEEKGGECHTNELYPKGEMDVLHVDKYGIKTYYEIKCSYKTNVLNKGISQVKKALKYGACDKGYVVTPEECLKIQNPNDRKNY